jgi:hypothetical protein
MKFVLILLLSSCAPKPEISPIDIQVAKGMQWLRIAQAYTEGCLYMLDSPTSEDKKECHQALDMLTRCTHYELQTICCRESGTGFIARNLFKLL